MATPLDSRAQTNAQLFLQIIDRGCSPAELCLVRDAYGLAMELYTGIYTGSGKPMLAHDVGTASLAHRHGASFATIAAGMLHGAYLVGNWGHYRTRVNAAKRKKLQQVIGAEAESYVYDFTVMQLYTHGIAEPPGAFNEHERNVIFIRLVEELDRLLDFGAVLYFRKAEKIKAELRIEGPRLCRLANRIGHPALAAELERALDLTLTTELPAELLGLKFPGEFVPLVIPAPLVIPKSCQQRPLLTLTWALSRAATRVSRGVRRRILPG